MQIYQRGTLFLSLYMAFFVATSATVATTKTPKRRHILDKRSKDNFFNTLSSKNNVSPTSRVLDPRVAMDLMLVGKTTLK